MGELHKYSCKPIIFKTWFRESTSYRFNLWLPRKQGVRPMPLRPCFSVRLVPSFPALWPVLIGLLAFTWRDSPDVTGLRTTDSMQELVLVSVLFLFGGKISMIIQDNINNKIQRFKDPNTSTHSWYLIVHYLVLISTH